jgi:DNA-binding MarR family transcriptional regulator
MSAQGGQAASTIGGQAASTIGEQSPQLDPAEQLGRSFKGALAALRRMRGRELRLRGGLSEAQYSLLFALRERSELPSSELACAANLSPASATEMLDALAVAGLVERMRSQRDRRVVMTSLTDRGRALVEERRARFEPRFRAALARFSEAELLTAAAVLDELGAMFDEVADQRADSHSVATPVSRS